MENVLSSRATPVVIPLTDGFGASGHGKVYMSEIQAQTDLPCGIEGVRGVIIITSDKALHLKIGELSSQHRHAFVHELATAHFDVSRGAYANIYVFSRERRDVDSNIGRKLLVSSHFMEDMKSLCFVLSYA